MKSGAFSFMLLCFVFVQSCNKKDAQPLLPVNSKILPGVWELREVVGGGIPYNPNNFKPGNGTLWTFTDKNFQAIYKDSVYRSGIYTISHNTGVDLNTGRKIDQFIFNSQPAESLKLANDTLHFYYGMIAADGDIEMFVKISNDTTMKVNH